MPTLYDAISFIHGRNLKVSRALANSIVIDGLVEVILRLAPVPRASFAYLTIAGIVTLEGCVGSFGGVQTPHGTAGTLESMRTAPFPEEGEPTTPLESASALNGREVHVRYAAKKKSNSPLGQCRWR